MPAPITVNYTPNGDEWTVTVAIAGEQATTMARAAGLIAARDRADQLVAQLAPHADRRVVHLLDGDAYAFTNKYLQARLGLPDASRPPDRVVRNDTEPTPPWPDALAAGAESPDDVENRR
jgi:hypothetical protein